MRSSVLLPVRGEPTTATWPAAPPRSSSNGSVRCSDGRSSRPTTARTPSARSPPRHHGALVSTASSGSASGSGATQTWCTGGRSPDRRSTSTCSSLGPALTGSATADVLHPRPRLEDLDRRGRLLPHRRAHVRAGGERRAELDVLLGVDLQVAEAGQRGQQVGVRRPEDELGLDGRVRPQAQPVAQVALQPPQPALVEPLRGQQQVDAQRPPHAAEADEEVDELRPRGQQLGELVDDDQQVGHRRHRRVGLRGAPGRRRCRRGCRPPAASSGAAPARRSARRACGRRARGRAGGW